jgi:hypothetical protein
MWQKTGTVSQEKRGYSDGTGKLAAKLPPIPRIAIVKQEYNMNMTKHSRHVTELKKGVATADLY